MSELTPNDRLDIELRNKGNEDVQRLLTCIDTLNGEIAMFTAYVKDVRTAVEDVRHALNTELDDDKALDQLRHALEVFDKAAEIAGEGLPDAKHF